MGLLCAVNDMAYKMRVNEWVIMYCFLITIWLWELFWQNRIIWCYCGNCSGASGSSSGEGGGGCCVHVHVHGFVSVFVCVECVYLCVCVFVCVCVCVCMYDVSQFREEFFIVIGPSIGILLNSKPFVSSFLAQNYHLQNLFVI